MTRDQENAEIAKAVREYSENKNKIARLERRLKEFCGHLQPAVEAEILRRELLEDIAAFRGDPRQDAAELKTLLNAQARLQGIFRAHKLWVD